MSTSAAMSKILFFYDAFTLFVNIFFKRNFEANQRENNGSPRECKYRTPLSVFGQQGNLDDRYSKISFSFLLTPGWPPPTPPCSDSSPAP